MKLVLAVVLLIAVGANADTTAVENSLTLLKKITTDLYKEVDELVEKGKRVRGDEEQKAYIHSIQPFLKERSRQLTELLEKYRKVMDNNIMALDRTDKRIALALQQLNSGEITLEKAVDEMVTLLTVAKVLLRDFE